ncbi:MAG: SDR family oxidoreductase [Pseudomonadota bacterium]
MPESQRDKRVLLVVGASNGIGAATAETLAAKGHRVYGTSRDAARIALENVEPLSLDVFEDASIEEAINAVIRREGRLDGLIYSAGFYVAGAAEETPLQDVQDQLHAYFFGAVRCAQIALPHMRARRFGRLIFMSSTAGTIAIPFHAAYSASKGALGRWVEAFAYEVEPFNIYPSYIEAGPIRTNAPNAMRSVENPLADYRTSRAKAEAGFKKSINSGLKPEVIGKAIAKAIESDKPRIRYRVGTAGKIFPFMQAVMGERGFRGLMKKSFNL